MSERNWVSNRIEYQKVEKKGNYLYVKFRKNNKDDFYELVELMKNLGGIFKPKSKSWEIIASKENIDILKAYDFDLSSFSEEEIDARPKRFKKVDRKVLEGLYKYQIKGVDYLEGTYTYCKDEYKGVILGDEMGLGKTITTLGFIKVHPEFKNILVICPSTIKLKWQMEFKKWTGKDSVVLYGRNSYSLRKNEENIIIINYDILHNWYEILKGFHWDLIIADEGHNLSNPEALRTQAFLSLLPYSFWLIFLSGTPIRNYPKDFFTMLNVVDPKTFKNRWEFLMRYCNPKHNGFSWEFKGATRVNELKSLINPILIRREKSEVLKELPEKQRIIIPLEKDTKGLDDYLKEYEDIKEWINDTGANNYIELKSKIEKLKQYVYFVKRNSVINWIKEYLEVENKLVVFAYHIRVLEDLYKNFKDIAVLIYGKTDSKIREVFIRKFQEEEKVKLFIGQMFKAAGEGIDLTSSSAVAFVEFSTVPYIMGQAEDRIHRIGQKADSVFIYYLVAPNTIDEDIINNFLIPKSRMINSILGDKNGYNLDTAIDFNEITEKDIIYRIVENMKGE